MLGAGGVDDDPIGRIRSDDGCETLLHPGKVQWLIPKFIKLYRKGYFIARMALFSRQKQTDTRILSPTRELTNMRRKGNYITLTTQNH